MNPAFPHRKRISVLLSYVSIILRLESYFYTLAEATSKVICFGCEKVKE